MQAKEDKFSPEGKKVLQKYDKTLNILLSTTQTRQERFYIPDAGTQKYVPGGINTPQNVHRSVILLPALIRHLYKQFCSQGQQFNGMMQVQYSLCLCRKRKWGRDQQGRKKSNLGRQEIARRYLHLGLSQLCA